MPSEGSFAAFVKSGFARVNKIELVRTSRYRCRPERLNGIPIGIRPLPLES